MNTKAKMGDSSRRGMIGAALTVLVGLCLWTFPIGQSLAHLSYDLPCVFNSRFVSDEVVIVQMDEASSRDPGLEPFSGPISFRPWHARLLDRLNADRSKMVVFDGFMKGPGSQATDKGLVRARNSFVSAHVMF